MNEISTSMGVNTKPAHRLEIDGYWILIDPKAPICLVNKINEIDRLKAQIKFSEDHVNELVKQVDLDKLGYERGGC